MRILHVTPYWADAWAYGGIPRVAGALVRTLAAAGHHVTVCTTDAYSRESRRPANAGRESGGIDLRVFPNRSNRLAYDWQCFTPVGLGRYLRDHACEFDVAHLHACRNFPGAIAAHHLDRYGVPYVIQPNGTAPAIERRFAAKRVFDAVAGTRMMRRAAAVLAVSDAERRQLLEIGVAEDRIHVMPNPVDLDEFDAPIERSWLRARLGLTNEPNEVNGPIVAFLGKVTPRKRLDVAVRAFARMASGARLVIAGSDMGGLGEARALAESLGVADRTHFLGLLTGHERLAFLAAADVVVYPSEDEVFGLVAIESLLAGTPVVVCDDSGCGEIVRRAGGGLLVPAGNDVALAQAIEEILGAGDRMHGAVAVAAERIRLDYDARRIAGQLERVYEGVARLPAAAPVRNGVTFLVPVKNGLPGLTRTLDAIESQAQADGRAFEILVVDDRSTDGSADLLAERARDGRIRLVRGEGRGVSAALNLGLRLAAHFIVCQIDQDVEILPGWIARLVEALERDERLGAVEGQYTVDSRAPWLARLMAIDLEQRYESIDCETDHVCTGNTAFRTEALRAAGGFDEVLGYGNDVDVSGRIVAAGWRLAHCRQARSRHRWKSDYAGYLRQQYGFGYGRLEIVQRGLGKVSGDRVAPAPMMLHPLVLTLGLALLATAGVCRWLGVSGTLPMALGFSAIGGLVLERTYAGLRAFFRFGHAVALLFPVVHLARDLAWVAAIAVFAARRLAGLPPAPSHSMIARPASPGLIEHLRSPARSVRAESSGEEIACSPADRPQPADQ